MALRINLLLSFTVVVVRFSVIFLFASPIQLNQIGIYVTFGQCTGETHRHSYPSSILRHIQIHTIGSWPIVMPRGMNKKEYLFLELVCCVT